MSSVEEYTRQRRWMNVAVVVLLFILIATALAYTKHIPVEIKQIPYYDSIGHFLLFGILSFALYWALAARRIVFMGYSFPTSAVVVICYAIIDEFLQLFSSARTFDLSDLLFGMLGVIMFTSLAVLFTKQHSM